MSSTDTFEQESSRILRDFASMQGVNDTKAQFNRTLDIALDRAPDNWFETAMKYASLPAQYAAWLGSRAGPEYLQREYDKQGWVPDSISEQRTFMRLFTDLAGMQPHDLSLKAAPFILAGLAADFWVDPLSKVKALRGSEHLMALKAGIRSVRPEAFANLARLAELGGPEAANLSVGLMRDQGILRDLKSAIAAGQPVIQEDAGLAARIAKGDRSAITARESIGRMNRQLTELHDTGFFDSPRAEGAVRDLTTQMVGGREKVRGLNATASGLGRLVSFGGKHAQGLPSRFEQAVATALEKATAPAGKALDRLRKALGQTTLVPELDVLVHQVAAQRNVDERDIVAAVTALEKKAGRKLSPEDWDTVIDHLERPLAEKPAVFGALQDIRAFVKSDKYRTLTRAEKATQGTQHEIELTEEARDFYSHRGMNREETAAVRKLAVGPDGVSTDDAGREYLSLPVRGDEAARVSAFYRDLKGAPGLGVTAVETSGKAQDRVGTTTVRLLGSQAIRAAEVSESHVDGLQRLLAVAAQKGWGLPANADLDALVHLHPSGTFQLVDARPMTAFGTHEEALANSAAAVQAWMAKRAVPGDPALLLDPKTALKIRAESVKRDSLEVAASLERLVNPNVETRYWDRAVLEGAARNARHDFPAEELDAVAGHIRETGSIPAVRVAFDPYQRPWIADESSQRVLSASTRLERPTIPVEVVPMPFASEMRVIPAAQKVPTQVPIHAGASRILPDGPATESAMRTLRAMGLGDAQVNQLASARFLAADGTEVIGLESLTRAVSEGIAQAKGALRTELQRLAAVNPALKVDELLGHAFPAAGGIDRKALQRLGIMYQPNAVGGATAVRDTVKSVNALDDSMMRAYSFLSTLDPQALGQRSLYMVTPTEGGALAVKVLGEPSLQYAAEGLNSAAQYAALKGVHPATSLIMARYPLDPGLVLGTEQFVPLARMAKSLPTAVQTLATESLKKVAAGGGAIGLTDAKIAELSAKGITINGKNVMSNRLRDTDITTGFTTPGGQIVIGRGWTATDAIAKEVAGELPLPMQEHFRIDQNGVLLHNLQWSLMDTLQPATAAKLNDRLKLLAQRFKDAGVPEVKQLDFMTTLRMDIPTRDAIFGDTPPSIRDILDGSYKVKIPEQYAGKMVDVAAPIAGVSYSVRSSADGAVQTWIDGWRQITGEEMATDEVMNRLMLPESLRAGYYARILTPEARKAMDDWFSAVAKEEPNGGVGRLYSFINQHYGKRAYSQLSTREINELFTKGLVKTADGRELTRDAIMRVKLKDGTKLADALKAHPEAYSFFSNDVREALMIRTLAGKRSVRNAQFHDALKSLAVPLPTGQTEISRGELGRIVAAYRAGEALPAEQQALARMWIESGTHSAVLDARTARDLVSRGQLPAEILDKVGNDALIRVEGRFFEDPRWKDGMIRFMPRQAIEEVNKFWRRVTDLPSLNRLVAGYHSYLNLWKRTKLFTSPKFFTRNAISNFMLAWQADLSPTNFSVWREARDILAGYNEYTRFTPGSMRAGEFVLKEGGNVGKGIAPTAEFTNVAGQTMRVGDFHELMNYEGLYFGMFHKEVDRKLSEVVAGRGIPSLNSMPLEAGWTPRWSKPIDEAIEPLAKVHEGMENYFRFAIAWHNWKNLGKTPQEAAFIAKKVMGGNHMLTPTEQVLWSGVFPFYRWLRFSIPRHVAWHVERPEQVYRAWRAVTDVGRGGANVPEDELPSWVNQRYHVNFGKDPKTGQYGVFMLDGFWPATDFWRFTGLNPLETTVEEGFGALAPPLRMALEGGLNRRLPKGDLLERVPGELSQSAYSGPVPLPGLTARPTTHGPLGPLNLLWNESAFQSAPIAPELGRLFHLFAQEADDPGFPARLRNFLIGKVTNVDPVKSLIAHRIEAKQTMEQLWSRLRSAVRDGNDAKREYYTRLINAQAVLAHGDPDD